MTASGTPRPRKRVLATTAPMRTPTERKKTSRELISRSSVRDGRAWGRHAHGPAARPAGGSDGVALDRVAPRGAAWQTRGHAVGFGALAGGASRRCGRA